MEILVPDIHQLITLAQGAAMMVKQLPRVWEVVGPAGIENYPVTPAFDQTAARFEEFLKSYRKLALDDTYEAGRTDGIVPDRKPYAPLQRAALDALFVEPRIGEGHDPNVFDRGAPLPADQLVERARHLIVRGPAGAGKSTWLRWTFRRLLERTDTFPIFIEARRVPRSTPGDPMSPKLDRTAAEALDHFFADRRAPRPIILVDGWDELGGEAEDLRRQLRHFLIEHPRALASCWI